MNLYSSLFCFSFCVMNKAQLFFAGTILMTIVMIWHGAPLKTCITPGKIVDLEFCWTPERATTVMNAWAGRIDCPTQNTTDINRIERAKDNIWIDYIFIFFYSGLFYQIYRKLWKLNPISIFKIAYLSAIIMGLCDVLENVNMQMILYHSVHTYYTHMAGIFAAVKFGLLLILFPFSIWSLLKLLSR